MSDKLQSNKNLATQFGERIKASVECVGKFMAIILGQTNLKVVDQMSAVCTALESCSTDFRSLVEKDADSIPGLQEALEDFDTALSIKREVD